MATKQDIDSTFWNGEYVEFTVQVVGTDGNPVSSATDYTVDLVIKDSYDDAFHLEFDTGDAQVNLTDTPNVVFTFSLLPSDLTTLTEGQGYQYYVWSRDSTIVPEQPRLQAFGNFRLQKSGVFEG